VKRELTNIQRWLHQCVRCGTCRSVCPVLDEVGWESASPRGRIMAMKGLQWGDLPAQEAKESLNTCTTCGICTASCPAGIDPPMMVQFARRELVSRGIASVEHRGLRENVSRSGNVLGESYRGWPDISPSLLADRAEYVYFAGCMASYRYPQTAARTIRLLSRFGVSMMPDEHCCGSPLLRTGFSAEDLIKANLEQIKKLGAHTVITGCAGCYTTLKKDYPPGLRVLSVPEFLEERVPQLEIKPLDLKVTYHDPCHLGRAHKIYEQPRQVIEAVCQLREMKENRESSRCCGGGGGVRAGYRDLSLRMARRRLEDVPQGIDYVVTSCPMCIRNLRDAGRESVIDLADLVAMALKEDPVALEDKNMPSINI
jgi:fumarate reductase (CoM/CoB) subunit B